MNETNEEATAIIGGINSFEAPPEPNQLNEQNKPSGSVNINSNKNFEVISAMPLEKNYPEVSNLLEGGDPEDWTTTTMIEKELTENQVDESKEQATLGEELGDHTLEGGATQSHAMIHEYKISYLADDDEKLVNPEKIKAAVTKYIENYNSEAMKKYKQLFKNIYQKYSNKRYHIENSDTEIIVSKPSSDGKKKPDIVFEVNKPTYIFYNKDNGLTNLKQRIDNKRAELQLHYQTLVNKLDVTPEEKKAFEKERKTFIDMLERYYIFTLYHQQINNIYIEGKTPLLIQQLEGFIKENTERGVALKSNIYYIENTLIDNINAINSSRLNDYNELIAKLKGAKIGAPVKKDDVDSKTELVTSHKSTNKPQEKKQAHEQQKIITEIKEYIQSREELAKLQNQIIQSVKIQNAQINYIINKLPQNA